MIKVKEAFRKISHSKHHESSQQSPDQNLILVAWNGRKDPPSPYFKYEPKQPTTNAQVSPSSPNESRDKRRSLSLSLSSPPSTQKEQNENGEFYEKLSYEDIIAARKDSKGRRKSENIIDYLNLDAKGVELSALLAEKYKTNPTEGDCCCIVTRKDSTQLRSRKHSLQGIIQKQSKTTKQNDTGSTTSKRSSKARRKLVSLSLEPNKLLEKAIHEGYIDIVEGLVSSGQININKLNDQGFAPLHLAAYVGNADMIETLLNNSAFIDILDSTGFSPLEIAVGEGSFDCARILIENGADQALILDGVVVKNRASSVNSSR